MSFFSNLRADRFITQIIATKDPNDPETQKAAARLKSLGGAAVESLFAALADADKNATVVFVDVLASIVNAKNFHLFTRGLVEGGPRVVAGISWALSSSRAYPPHLLLEALQLEGI